MRRTAAAMVAIALGLTACGGDDDTAEPADEPAEEPAEEPADEPDEEPADEPADEPAAEPAEEPADEPAEEPADEPADDGGSIGSLDDIPDRCKDLMADYLRDIEPIVADIDWSTAVFSDFEAIADEIDERATEFDTRSVEEDCDDLDFGDDDGLDLLVEFADDVAPDTVPFFTFLVGMSEAVSPEGDGDDGTTAGSLETCDDAIAVLEELIAEYDSFTDVPMEQFLQLTNIGAVMMTCTPEQLEFFESPEVEEFLSG